VWSGGPTFGVLFQVYYYNIKPEKVSDVPGLIDHYVESVEGGLTRMQTDMTQKYKESPIDVYKKAAASCGANATPVQVLNHAIKLSHASKYAKAQQQRNQQQELAQRHQAMQRATEAARREAEAKLNEPGPLIKTAFQRAVIRSMMHHALRSMELSKSISQQITVQPIVQADVEAVVHDAVDQYVRCVLHRLVRDYKYQRRSREQTPLAGMKLLSSSNRRKHAMLHQNVQEQQQRMTDDFRPIVAEYDEEETINIWKQERRRSSDTFKAEAQMTLDEQSQQLLKASVCGDTMGIRYRDMLNGSGSENADASAVTAAAAATKDSRVIGMDGLQRLVSEQRRELHSTRIRQRPPSVASISSSRGSNGGSCDSSSSRSSGSGGSGGSGGSSSGTRDQSTGNKRKRTSETMDESRIRISFSRSAMNFVFDGRIPQKNLLRRMDGFQ
jgi:uncharacterized membrane protein YgcG